MPLLRNISHLATLSDCQLLNFHARVMDLRAQETLFGGLEKWQRMQLQYSYGDMHEIIVRAVDDT